MGSETVIKTIYIRTYCGLFQRDFVTIKLERYCLLIFLCFAHCLIVFFFFLLFFFCFFFFVVVVYKYFK